MPGLGATDERIVAHDTNARTFAYSVDAEKIPGFVQNMTNTWTLTPTDDSTRVVMRLTADIGGPLAPIMNPMMRRQFNKTLSGIEVDRDDERRRCQDDLGALAEAAAVLEPGPGHHE